MAKKVKAVKGKYAKAKDAKAKDAKAKDARAKEAKAKDVKTKDAKGKGKGKDKRGGKNKKEEPPPPLPEEIVLEEQETVKEDVQFTETSYTSASFESLPPVPHVEEKPKRKRKKKGVEEEVIKIVEEFQWSEDSLPEVEEEIQVVSPTEEPKKAKTKKSKKGKKGKKGKKEKEVIPVFEKPKKWKKMNKKEREKWLEERIAQWRIEEEQKKQELLASIKEKRKTDAKQRLELTATNEAEQEIRRDILLKTCNLFRNFEKQKIIYANEKQAVAEWQQYLRCDGLPDPRVVTQMATYLHLWQQQEKFDDNDLDVKCKETFPMMEMLEEFVLNSRIYTQQQAENYNEIRLALRAQLSHAIQHASYMVLRDLEHTLTFSSIRLATYERAFTGLRLNIWVAIRMPTRKPMPVLQQPEPIELQYPALKVSVTLPNGIDTACVCVRAAKSMLDLLSESSRTFALWSEMPNRYQDLFIFNVQEYMAVLELTKAQKEERSEFYKGINARAKELEGIIKANIYVKNKAAEDELDDLNMKEITMTDPRTIIALENEHKFKKYLKKCNTHSRKGEIHLRKYRICGGILNLDLLQTPPQPKRLQGEVYLTTLELPKELREMAYQVQYRTPPPPESGVIRPPEEIEAELKKIEEEYQKLALVHIELPEDVMWTEPPLVCQWQEKRKLWTTNYVNDYKFNEEKLTVQFRTGVLWPIALATLRYSNMPYIGWDMKPNPYGSGKGVLLTVSGVSLTVTWLCIGNYVMLKSILNAPTPALKQHFNKKYSVKKMITLMKEAACDFFPDFDGHNHVEGTCPKEWVIELHTYHAMAFLSTAYNFQWSRWNVQAGSRNLVMQFREAVDKKREAKLQLLKLNPERTTILQINEMSPEYSEEPIMGMEFFPDLFTLNMSYGSVDARRTTFGMKYKLVEVVYEMLQELKLLSFS